MKAITTLAAPPLLTIGQAYSQSEPVGVKQKNKTSTQKKH
jgi:hypothetical protein